ncbi:MAG: hypothetical protein IPM83_16055 [Ignavibacteria bacterium]|nr:hypothetical protein [Ignavibacteria bacterium]
MVDYSFGLAATVFPQILGELKCRTLGMNSYVDASHFADPLAEVLDESSIIMRSLGYEIGFKIDPVLRRSPSLMSEGYGIHPCAFCRS